MTPAEVGELLDMKQNTVIVAVRNGELPGFYIGSRVRIPTAKIAELLGLPYEPAAAGPDPGETTS